MNRFMLLFASLSVCVPLLYIFVSVLYEESRGTVAAKSLALSVLLGVFMV